MRSSDLSGYPEHIRKQILEKLDAEPKKSKFAAEKTEQDGITFDSKKEANHYAELLLREKAGEISQLRIQPKYLLQEKFSCNGKQYRKIEYVADFEYVENGETVVIDVKGFKTDVYKLKKKLFLFRYGEDIKFLEV